MFHKYALRRVKVVHVFHSSFIGIGHFGIWIVSHYARVPLGEANTKLWVKKRSTICWYTSALHHHLSTYWHWASLRIAQPTRPHIASHDPGVSRRCNYSKLHIYTQTFDMSASIVGSLFILFCGSYAATAVLFGRISDKIVSTRQQLAFFNHFNVFSPFSGMAESDNVQYPWAPCFVASARRSVRWDPNLLNFTLLLWPLSWKQGRYKLFMAIGLVLNAVSCLCIGPAPFLEFFLPTR